MQATSPGGVAVREPGEEEKGGGGRQVSRIERGEKEGKGEREAE